MENLKQNSIRIPGRIVVCWPQYGDKEETLDMTEAGSKFNGAYNTNNSTICFIIDHEIFVTPYTREAMSTIRSAGLVEKGFYVPFSNGDYPKYEKAKWERLREAAHESHFIEYEEDCKRWCDEHKIGKLSDGTMSRCFKIPRNGVPVKHPYYETVYHPACSEYYMDYTVVDKLGRYCFNNGKVVFIYRDGHTYVTKGYWILGLLRSSGYKEGSLFVPFSNGERITDPALAAQWDNIPRE